MTNDELAAEIERRCAGLAALIAETEKNGARGYVGEAERASQVGFFVLDNLPAILSALRTPAAAVGEDAVERASKAIADGYFICGYGAAHANCHAGAQCRCRQDARAALSADAMPAPQSGESTDG